MEIPKVSDSPKLGRLGSFGIREPWQALLLAPTRFESLGHVISCAADLHTPTPDDTLNANGALERRSAFVGLVESPASYDPMRKRCKMRLQLEDGTPLPVMMFGHPNQYPGDWRRLGARIALHGKLLLAPNGFAMLIGPKPVPIERLGKALGVYPGKVRVIKPDTVRERVLALISGDTLEQATGAILRGIAPYQSGDVLEAWSQAYGYPSIGHDAIQRAIRRMHEPETVAQGEAAKRLLMDLSALALLVRADQERPKQELFQPVRVNPKDLEARIQAMSHTPTQEQRQAVEDALGDIASGQPMHRLLSGDVGTGKTTVFALLAAAIYDAGGEVGIMLPSEDMVQQVNNEMRSWWPDLQISQITGASADDTRHRLRIGTTALISRKESGWRPTLVIVDEQQKYAAHQRQALSQHGGHLLEATATCLPRTMAQLQFGLIPISRLSQPHTPKAIDTAIWDSASKEGRQTLFKEVHATLAENAQVLVIYAARDKQEANESEAEPSSQQAAITSLEEGVERWRRVFGESEVAMLHGRMKPAERESNLERIRSGEARVLCATTAAEVGLNLPRLRHAIIINPERFGLVTLHQIRGRLARHGGWGRCDLLGDIQKLPDGSLERLQAFEREHDGFALAELDMRQRGMGSLLVGEGRQSGDTDAGLLVSVRPDFENFEIARQLLDQLAGTETLRPVGSSSPAPTL